MIKQWPLTGLLFLFLLAGTARADGIDQLVNLMGAPGASATTTSATQPDDNGGILRLTPDKTRILHLDQDAASVVVANPDHASVLLDSPRLLIVMPRQPGTTSFTVLNARGESILERTVIVSAVQQSQKYVRIRRMCSASDSSCVANAYYYCPDGCYEVSTVAPDGGAAQVPEIAAGTPPALPENAESAGTSQMNQPETPEESVGTQEMPAETGQQTGGQY